MTKFEEEVKRPDNGPITELNNSMQSVLSQYRKMREYATQLEDDSKQKDEHILKLENENSFMRDERTTFDSNGNSVEPIIPQQALPVVPECVAKDVKRLSLSTLADWNVAVSYISKETLEWLSTTGNINVFLGKSWTLCSLKINGFKVEKPQLFYLKNKLTGDCLAICLARASSGLYVEVTEKWLTRKEQTSYKLYFTQQEIASMQTGSYEQIEVAE